MGRQLVGMDEPLSIGDAWFLLRSPAGGIAVVFEDDGDTGYFYAATLKGDGGIDRLVDALHIYNVANIVDRDKPSRIQIGWSANGQAAVLLINRHPHAVVDFATKRAVCRSGFPPASGAFASSHAWDETLLELFF